MKNIKSLYNAAKFSGNDKDIAAYTEAVMDAFNTNPLGYVLQLEYILSSSIGIDTFIPFVEKYGLPISLYEKTKKCIDDCKAKLKKRGKENPEYDKAEKFMEKFHNKYAKCIAMNEYLVNDPSDTYIESYYTNVNGHSGRTLIKGMYERYGAESIMDSIITAHSMDSMNTAIKYFEHVITDSGLCEALVFATSDMDIDHSIMENVKANSASTIVSNMKARNYQVYRESVITGNDEMQYEYSNDEIYAIEQLLHLKEFCMCCDDIGVNINEYQSDVMSLYEELDGIVEEDGANIVQMLPGMQTGTESIFKPAYNTSLMNTRDKKTGQAPTYLSRNHDMINYGETDKPVSDKDEDEEEGKSLEDYRRPSSIKPTTQINDTENDDEDEDETPIKKVTPQSSKSISSDDNYNHSGGNNYYYYTYTNSLNKNTNSFNHDDSTHDDHSKHIKHDNHAKSDDHSTHNIKDDHSYNKRIRSNDYNDHDQNDEYDNIKEEAMPWELNVINKPEVFNEEVGDADDMKPKSDHPIKDAFMDIDRKTTKVQQSMKKGVQDVQNVGRAAMKPVNRVKNWVGKMIGDYKDANETNIKEKLADPHARKNIFTAASKAIKVGALYKAGILLNPAFLFLAATKGIADHGKTKRIRQEMIGEIRNEIEIIKSKIEDCGGGYGESDPEKKEAKYKLMRLKNELEKKLLRVEGGNRWHKVI